jgi:hypothetical protein
LAKRYRPSRIAVILIYPDLVREHAAYEYVKQHGAEVTSLHVAMNSMVKPDADFFLETRIA